MVGDGMLSMARANWAFGWGLILAAFVTGAALGLGFHRGDYLGGYASFRRRIVRLGHISLAAIGMLNVLYGLSPVAAPIGWTGRGASLLLMVGGVTMPLVCFLTGWRPVFRHLFFVPVACLSGGVALVLLAGVA